MAGNLADLAMKLRDRLDGQSQFAGWALIATGTLGPFLPRDTAGFFVMGLVIGAWLGASAYRLATVSAALKARALSAQPVTA